MNNFTGCNCPQCTIAQRIYTCAENALNAEDSLQYVCDNMELLIDDICSAPVSFGAMIDTIVTVGGMIKEKYPDKLQFISGAMNEMDQDKIAVLMDLVQAKMLRKDKGLH